MSPFVDDLHRANALPEQPPEGAMSYNEFVRTRSNDPEMRTLEAMINHLLADELRAQESRETIHHEVNAGRKHIWNGFLDLLSNERNASSQRVGFLLGYATAFHVDSDIVTRARTFSAGHDFSPDVAYVAVGAAGHNIGTNNDTAMADMTETNSGRERNEHAEVNDISDTNGTHMVDPAITTNDIRSVNGNDEARIEDPTLIMTPL